MATLLFFYSFSTESGNFRMLSSKMRFSTPWRWPHVLSGCASHRGIVRDIYKTIFIISARNDYALKNTDSEWSYFKLLAWWRPYKRPRCSINSKKRKVCSLESSTHIFLPWHTERRENYVDDECEAVYGWTMRCILRWIVDLVRSRMYAKGNFYAHFIIDHEQKVSSSCIIHFFQWIPEIGISQLQWHPYQKWKNKVRT